MPITRLGRFTASAWFPEAVLLHLKHGGWEASVSAVGLEVCSWSTSSSIAWDLLETPRPGPHPRNSSGGPISLGHHEPSRWLISCPSVTATEPLDFSALSCEAGRHLVRLTGLTQTLVIWFSYRFIHIYECIWCLIFTTLQAYFENIASSIPDHHNKASIAVKPVVIFSWWRALSSGCKSAACVMCDKAKHNRTMSACMSLQGKLHVNT